jgi:hypothetical protein
MRSIQLIIHIIFKKAFLFFNILIEELLLVKTVCLYMTLKVLSSHHKMLTSFHKNTSVELSIKVESIKKFHCMLSRKSFHVFRALSTTIFTVREMYDTVESSYDCVSYA